MVLAGFFTAVILARGRVTKADYILGEPTNLGSVVNSSANENGPCLSSDGSILYFSSDRAGGSGSQDIWQVSISPAVDFNGDGIVDVQDLIVLAEHLFEGAGLVAHWALDETYGDIAYDSTGKIDAVVLDGQWADGKINGALQFNGFETYMDCGDSLRLGTKKITLAMWLEPQHMGDTRYILSQAKDGSEDFDYVLMRYLEGEVEFAVAQEDSNLVSVASNATTPLYEWTHVVVCLDGSEAAIYNNGQLDSSAGYAQRIPCEGYRLWISSLGISTRFYNGKIDDVRIYNIALGDEEIEEFAQ